jgi:hypothetical protein
MSYETATAMVLLFKKKAPQKIFKPFVITTRLFQCYKHPVTIPGIIQLNPAESIEFDLITKLSAAEVEQSALHCTYFSYLQ